jgi:hypothetical protein
MRERERTVNRDQRSAKNPERNRWKRGGIVALLSLLFLISGSTTLLLPHQRSVRAANSQTLPGEQIWQQGVSSLLFGANDSSWQWSPNNLGNTPAIATAVRSAGVTVIRTPLSVSDALARVSAVEAAGAKCLGIISPPDALQVVQMLGNRCVMYEWMNEPDNNNLTADQYAASWNQNIPALRAANAQAMFIGPVVASPNVAYIQQFLTLAKQAGNIPDAVSFHMYPCTNQTIASCPAHIASYGQDTSQVQATVSAVLGYSLPLAVTEWNYSWKANQTPQNDPFIKTFTSLSLDAMAQAGISMAMQYDLASNAGGGTLDMVDPQTGQALPQLNAVQQEIQKYRIQVPVVGSGGTVTGIQTVVAQPTQPPISPQSVIISAPERGLFVLQQSLHCTTEDPARSQLMLTSPSAASNMLTLLGVTQDGCSLIFKVQDPQQTLRLNWWSDNAVDSTMLSFDTSIDSVDGPDNNWQSMPTSSKATGGTQMLNLENTAWVKVSIHPPAQQQSPTDLVMELYSLNDLTGITTVSPQAIWLSRH